MKTSLRIFWWAVLFPVFSIIFEFILVFPFGIMTTTCFKILQKIFRATISFLPTTPMRLSGRVVKAADLKTFMWSSGKFLRRFESCGSRWTILFLYWKSDRPICFVDSIIIFLIIIIIVLIISRFQEEIPRMSQQVRISLRKISQRITWMFSSPPP